MVKEPQVVVSIPIPEGVDVGVIERATGSILTFAGNPYELVRIGVLLTEYVSNAKRMNRHLENTGDGSMAFGNLTGMPELDGMSVDSLRAFASELRGWINDQAQ